MHSNSWLGLPREEDRDDFCGQGGVFIEKIASNINQTHDYPTDVCKWYHSAQTYRPIPKTYGGTYMPGNDCFFECMLPEK